jgi:hypothetical protein
VNQSTKFLHRTLQEKDSSSNILLFPEKETKSVSSASQKITQPKTFREAEPRGWVLALKTGSISLKAFFFFQKKKQKVFVLLRRR